MKSKTMRTSPATRIKEYTEKRAELEQRMLEIDWWIIKNMRHPDFFKRSSERNVLSTNIDLLRQKITRLRNGESELGTIPKSYSYINPNK